MHWRNNSEHPEQGTLCLCEHSDGDFKTVVVNEEIGTFRKITLSRCNFESYNFAFFESKYTDTVEISFEAYDFEY